MTTSSRRADTSQKVAGLPIEPASPASMHASQNNSSMSLVTWASRISGFLMVPYRRVLSQARSNELRAVLDYNKSQVDYETVQVAPVSGGGVSQVGGTSTTLGGAVTAGTAGALSGTVGPYRPTARAGDANRPGSKGYRRQAPGLVPMPLPRSHFPIHLALRTPHLALLKFRLCRWCR